MHDQKLSRKRFVGVSLGSAAAALSVDAALAQENSTPAAGTAGSEGTPVAQVSTAEETWVNGVENLTYNNPFDQTVAPFWYDGMEGFHLNLGGVNEEPPYPIAEQYLFVHADEFRSLSTPVPLTEAPLLKEQYVIFDSVPGDENYSPIWHNNWVLAPSDYEPQSIRSVQELMDSGLEIVPDTLWVI